MIMSIIGNIIFNLIRLKIIFLHFFDNLIIYLYRIFPYNNAVGNIIFARAFVPFSHSYLLYCKSRFRIYIKYGF